MPNTNISEHHQDKLLAALLDDGVLSSEQAKLAEDTAGKLSLDILRALSRLGLVGDDNLYSYAADVFGLELINKIHQCPGSVMIIDTCKDLGLSIDWCISNSVFPIQDGDSIHVYFGNPFLQNQLTPLRQLVNEKKLHKYLLTPAMAVSVADDITSERAVSELFGQSNSDMAALAEEAPVINLVNSVIERAIYAEASDIHVEPGSKNLTIRLRVDGKLSEFMQQPASRFQAIASRIKLLSGMDIAERRLPQDGRFTSRAGSREYDIRVSSAPDVNGESIVMRLLPKQRDELSIDGLGFAEDHLAMIRQWGKLSNGIILVTGPTGSGKSTTLYALLADVQSGDEKIVTVEDPVEYQLPGITQVQAKPEIGYTFAKALRTFLRQDPDIIMVGEIRDKETADIAIQSSLTGHLVLSTLHTNDACSVFPRLSDIGVESYLTAATIQGVQAQRLVRKLCEHCSVSAPKPNFLEQNPELHSLLENVSSPDWKQAVGCERCQGRGYRGRVGIYELIAVTPALRDLVAAKAPLKDIRASARASGFRSLLEDGLLKAARGLTSVDEVLRVCSSNEDA
ncbi:GspE/PulE family protein [Alteromonas gilva]|uniref:GspE/PulE family protein n=1 Tax=Alteromonas gilva TaxID=2987522 RepID=A0ABT5L8V5_9ALTE|nr:GspE/PulE family protein [Alteromonas gilva]MDC8833004.1 GspE/PulE family protein [Alteromonas gilva]